MTNFLQEPPLYIFFVGANGVRPFIFNSALMISFFGASRQGACRATLRFFLHQFLQSLHHTRLQRVFVKAAGTSHHVTPARHAALAAPPDPFRFREFVSTISANHKHLRSTFQVQGSRFQHGTWNLEHGTVYKSPVISRNRLSPQPLP